MGRMYERRSWKSATNPSQRRRCQLAKSRCYPAHVACQNRHTECLSLLINHGAQLDKADNEGFTPAIIAYQHGHTDCLSLLINHGAQLDKADDLGATPADIACHFGHTDCLSLLINHRYYPSIYGLPEWPQGMPVAARQSWRPAGQGP
jgi:ankyrin repeat protein